MAEEAQYSSGPDSGTAKRKYEDQTTPPPPSSAARRPTGFSAPISSQSPDSGHPPPSYNSVPPPLDEIQQAKIRAQEIAARIFNNVEAKRPKVENGGGVFDSTDNKGYGSADFVQKPFISSVSPGSIPVSYGYQGSSKKIEIPSGRVGVIIGKGGETIKYLQLQSGAKIQVTRDMDADPNSPFRMVELMGSSEAIAKAEQLINDVLAEAESGGSGLASRRPAGQQAGSDQFVMRVPNNKVGLIIGKGGETIKNMQATSGARIQVIPLHPPPGDTSNERTVQIDGTSEQIESAKQLVNEVISENRPRNSSMTGGYSQQGYQARPAGNWAPPGPPMQQPGYGYVQPGAYPGPPQYGVSQPTYGGYPPQPTSGGYATTGWDQTTAAANQQQTSQAGGGYDYYNQTSQQQQAPGGTTAPADSTTGYSYSQQPASGYNQGQAYAQDGYGGYQGQPGYGQPQQGYDQQQGYNAATSYGNVTNQTTDGHTPSYGAQGDATNQTAPPVQGQQGYNTAPQPSPSPGSGYPVQGAAQPGYGVAPTSQAGYGYGPGGYTQKPPANQAAYGQPGQSPGAQGGYVQPSYPPPAPTSGGYSAPTAQTGYAQPPYGGAAPAGYGGQPPAYGGGYSQAAPPVYSAADGNSGPASQTVQPGGVAKASPQS